MTELEQLKSKYPLAFDTIKLPVRYGVKDTDDEWLQLIVDSDNRIVAEPAFIMGRTNEASDQIGNLIAHLLNQLG